MGRMVMIKCDCGYFDDSLRYGVNMEYERVKKYQTQLVKTGRYGRAWKELLESDPELSVDAELNVYQCPKCYKLQTNYRLDLYKTGTFDGCYYTPSEEEIIHHFKHMCPDCGKRMERVPLKEGYYFEVPEELVICPKCGDAAILSFCGFTD